MADDEKINWNVDLEVGLFHAIYAHRPVGRNCFLIFHYWMATGKMRIRREEKCLNGNYTKL